MTTAIERPSGIAVDEGLVLGAIQDIRAKRISMNDVLIALGIYRPTQVEEVEGLRAEMQAFACALATLFPERKDEVVAFIEHYGLSDLQ
jgi:hypothetical protein